MHSAHDEQESSDHDGQHDVVQHHVIAQINQAEHLAARHRLQTVFTPSERCLQCDEKQHLRKRQRDHRGVDARSPDGKESHDQTQKRTAQRAQQQAQFRRQPPHLDDMARHVGGTTEKRGMAKGQHAGVAEQQIEGRSKEREAHELHDKDRIGAQNGGQQQPHKEQPVADDGNILEIHVWGPVNFLCRTGRRGESAAPQP